MRTVDGQADLTVHRAGGDATIADVHTAAGLPPAIGAWIDGPIGEVPEGTIIGSALRPPQQPIAAELHALAGPLAGRSWRLVAGEYVAGGSDLATIQLPDVRDFAVRVAPDGAVEVPGFDIDPAFWAGPHHLGFASPEPDAGPTPGGRWYFNRPPRARRGRPTVDLHPPARSPVRGRRRRIGVAALVAPIVTGILLALLFGRMLFLAFAAISPVMMVGTTWDDRRRRRREAEESEEQYLAELAQFTEVATAYRRDTLLRRYRDHPSPAALVARADRTGVSLWERRPGHDDFGALVVGYGEVPAPLPVGGPGRLEPEVVELLETAGTLACAPATVAITHGTALGIVGARPLACSAARALVAQACALHGPADLRVAVVTDDPTAWTWTKWLPHTCVNGGRDVRLLSGSPEDIGEILGYLRNAPDAGAPTTLLVLDHPGMADGDRRTAAAILAGGGHPVAGLVLAGSVAELPSRCTAVLDVSDRPAALWFPGRADHRTRIHPVTMAPDVAEHLARRLSPLEDPEAFDSSADLPDRVSLLDLLGPAEPDAGTIAERWARPARLRAALGATPGGTLEIDLVADGPHGLVAGTTGSGKSELLRTLVAGLAAGADTDHLTYVLVDYKGGAAFDVCADLPHVVGLVTDLDEQLASRALTCLEAELRHREQRLRDAGATSIDELWEGGPAEPLPRLVVVVDEFASLAAELPEFMDSLVDIARRGRSLGVHLVLATQRPAGVVKDSIRANTNLRVSLRVQTAADSQDVLGAPDAARIGRATPGRGLIRLGPGELIPFQTALATGRPSAASSEIQVVPFVFGLRQPDPPPLPEPDGPSDLLRLVTAIRSAHDQRGVPDPRRPWPDPLPERLPAEDLEVGTIGLVDLPDLQRQDPWSWDPVSDGNLLLAGLPAAGVGEAAAAAGLALAGRLGPDDLHLYAIDHGSGALSVLRDLPHTGAVVPGGSLDRQIRLLEHLRRELHHRQAGGRHGPTILLALDGLGGFRSAMDEPELLVQRDRLQEIVAAGPARGIFSIVTVDQARSLPGALAGALPSRLVFELADRLDYPGLGVPKPLADPVRGRAVHAGSGRIVQVTTDPAPLLPPALAWGWPTDPPPPITTLPERVPLEHVIDAGEIEEDRWLIPIGLDDRLLRPVGLTLHEGEHFLVAGPRRSGRSSVLLAVAGVLRKLDGSIRIGAVAGRRSPLRDHPFVDQIVEAVPMAPGRAPAVLLIDDAETVSDDLVGGLLAALDSSVRIVAAGRLDALRTLPRHWTRQIRGTRRGLVLQPTDPADGDVLGVRLPRTNPITTPGRGYLVDGSATLVQVALP